MKPMLKATLVRRLKNAGDPQPENKMAKKYKVSRTGLNRGTTKLGRRIIKMCMP